MSQLTPQRDTAAGKILSHLREQFRGEIGPFFTTREVVRFMAEMVDPRNGDIVCDPASGSGGFLIRFFAKVREQIPPKPMPQSCARGELKTNERFASVPAMLRMATK